MSLPSDAEITEQVRVIIEEAFDNGTVAEYSKRTIRNMLNEHFGVDLESKKKLISAATQDQVNRITAEREKAASTSHSPSPAKASKASVRASSTKARPSSASSRSKPAPKRKHPVSEDSDGEEAEPSASREAGQDADLSDTQAELTDFSELEDDASTSRSRKKSKPTKTKTTSATAKAPKGKAKASSSGGTEAEQRLARLKKLVIECGVRKQWKKLYEAADVSETDFAGQCTVVQGVLRELGMTGKGSVEQARKIREEREFADELAALQENTVMSSDRSRPTRASRTKSAVVAISDDEASNASDESDFETAAPAPRSSKKTAARETEDDAEDSDDEGPSRSRSFKSSLASFAADLNSDSD
ncbi:5'-3' exonuclease XRN1/KEM1/SEP1 [Moesziomyces antarcticus T-34]|uniref:5'-3' exonuclease XRN1/KEM1/SEP1 n=1 Tax=Pseudozyma antarctica (strain T-34) TaxID=1151754 RepID=M9LS87_PSEA3|nr:5'-3' exonuclease XRN1/KEM1/SEP1 [Moesziomyces antarcticus T-34]